MWTRIELKEKAKVAFKSNFWNCVLVAFIMGLLVNGSSCAGSSASSGSGASFDTDRFFENEVIYDDDYYYGYDDDYSDFGTIIDNNITSTAMGIGFLALSVVAVIVVILLIAGIILRIFVFAPLEVGGNRFFMDNSTDHASASLLFYAFSSGHYKNIVATLFFRDLYTFLWSLLFVIPGIVKFYEYRMVPYLLADCPDMPREDAFAISKELMTGNKWNAFVLDLSFFGWHILNTFTCGLLGIFWTSPYIQATNAELFLALKRNYFSGQYMNQGAAF